MEALLTSTFSVAIAEIGDKTQLLALLLALRFPQKATIIAGILLSTLLNHFVAAWLGQWLINWVSADFARYCVAGSFFIIAFWVLIPDKVDNKESKIESFGPFLATFILFFMAEMGDKTQIATMVLAAKYDALMMVVIGTTLGMLIANVPVVFACQWLRTRIHLDQLPLKWIHRGCALLFILLGVSTLLWQ